jgi:hypothetical protein
VDGVTAEEHRGQGHGEGNDEKCCKTDSGDGCRAL